MDLNHCVTESELLNHTALFQFPLECTKDEFARQLKEQFSSSPACLKDRTAELMRLRLKPELVKKSYERFKALREAETLLKSHKPSTTSQVAEEQIFFSGQLTKPLNSVPYLLTLLVFLKIYIAPLMALAMPLLLFVMPYVVMRTIMNSDIPWDVYVPMMKQMMFGITPGQTWSAKQYAQMGWTVASLAQGMISPFMTAYHTYHLDTTIVERGRAIQRLCSVAKEVATDYETAGCKLTSLYLQIPQPPSDPREAVAWMESEPLVLKIVWKALGQLSLLTTLAMDTNWIPFKPVLGFTKTVFDLEPFSDLAIPEEKAVKSSLSLKGHSLLTGPNRGGKSSALRGTLQQVLLAQTFGMTYRSIGSWKPFRNVFTRLKSKDHAGKESLFEMEVRMAAHMLNATKNTQTHTLLLIDELFHSTNPPDAEISATLFLQQLWKLPNAKSIISTHIFRLCELSSKGIETLCCDATESNGEIQYSYKLQPGICRVSSVREVLRENNLLCA